MSIIPTPEHTDHAGNGHTVTRRRRIRAHRPRRPLPQGAGGPQENGTVAAGDDLMAVAAACGVDRQTRSVEQGGPARVSGIPDDAAGLLAAAGGDLAAALRILGEPTAQIEAVTAASTDPSRGPARLREVAHRIDVQLRQRREQLAEQEASPLSLALREVHAALRWAQLHLDAAETLLAASPRP